MSEFHVIEVKFKDESILITTLKEMGYKPEVHKEAKSLYGYQGDERPQKAHIIIPRKQVGMASNDVGFEKTKGGFVLHASEFDHAWRTGEKIQDLNQRYSENKLKKTISVMSNCNIFSRKKNEAGQIEIQLKIM